MASLKAEFREDMVEFGRLSTKMLGYAPSRVYQMMQECGEQYGAEEGAVEAARSLIQKPDTKGLTDLADHGVDGLKISVEWLVIQPKYGTLFRPDEKVRARKTLTDHGFPAALLPTE